MEPITLFARTADQLGVARILREASPNVEIDGPDDNWNRATVTFGRGKRKRTLTLTHDPEYLAGENGERQRSGMRGYFSRFPDTDRKPRVMMLTTTFVFSLGTLFEPDPEPSGDPRLDVLFAVTGYLDGVLFTPSSLRDARGRILFGAGGEESPDAEWPRVLGTVPIDSPLGASMHEASRRRPPGEAAEGGGPPDAARVARRALALTALTLRAILERDFAEGHPAAAATYADLLAWVAEVGIDEEFEADERELLGQPLGTASPQMGVNAAWRVEGLAVLGWALGRYDLPPHDELVSLNPLWQAFAAFDAEAAAALLAAPTLRPRAEIGTLRDRLFALHWRLRNYRLHPGVMDFATFAADCNFGPLDVTGLPLIDRDLALGGDRIDRASPDAFSSAHSAAQERHQAANWLWEGPDTYSEASVAT